MDLILGECHLPVHIHMPTRLTVSYEGRSETLSSHKADPHKQFSSECSQGKNRQNTPVMEKNGPIWKAGEVSPGQVKSSGPEAIQRENLLDEVRTVGSGRRFLTRV